jgi:hypothetical protein
MVTSNEITILCSDPTNAKHQQLEKTVAGSWAGPATEASTVPALQSFHQSTNNDHPSPLHLNWAKRRSWYIRKGAQAWDIRRRNCTQIRPVWVGDLRTKPKNSKVYGWGLSYIYLFIGKYRLELSGTALRNTKWRFASQNHKLFLHFLA